MLSIISFHFSVVFLKPSVIYEAGRHVERSTQVLLVHAC